MKFINVCGRRTNVLVMHDLTPPPLIERQRACDCNGLTNPQRLHGGSQTTVNNEDVQVPKKNAEVGSVRFEETRLGLQLLYRMLHITRHFSVFVAGWQSDIDYTKIGHLTLFDHHAGSLQNHGTAARHTADGDDAQFGGVRFCLLHETIELRSQRRIRHTALWRSEEDEGGSDDLVPEVRWSFKCTGVHGNQKWLFPSPDVVPELDWLQVERCIGHLVHQLHLLFDFGERLEICKAGTCQLLHWMPIAVLAGYTRGL
mmetsp:Transcript_52627/g.140267  ORF Transcript_52627/g.140267 Transcript_52627/m.140267 type:complete len:257 (-) Transcript_52627:955-1725(-)